jgi:hypothetical protein
MLCACFAASTKCDSMGRDSKQSQAESDVGQFLAGEGELRCAACAALRFAGCRVDTSAKR